jgi:hypothetical protein
MANTQACMPGIPDRDAHAHQHLMAGPVAGRREQSSTKKSKGAPQAKATPTGQFAKKVGKSSGGDGEAREGTPGGGGGGGSSSSARTPGSSKRPSDGKSPGPGMMNRGIYESLPEEMDIGRRIDEEPTMKELVEGIIGAIPQAIYSQKLNQKLLVVGKLSGKSSWKRREGAEKCLRGRRRANGQCEEGGKRSGRSGREGADSKEEFGGLVGMHAMWKEHIARMSVRKVGKEESAKKSSISAVLKDAELRGAMVKIISGKCPSAVGLEGIVTRETRNTVGCPIRAPRCKGTRDQAPRSFDPKRAISAQPSSSKKHPASSTTNLELAPSSCCTGSLSMIASSLAQRILLAESDQRCDLPLFLNSTPGGTDGKGR